MRQLRGIVRSNLIVYRAQPGAFRENVRAHRADVRGARKWPKVREDDQRIEEISGGVER
jgi:hypothetical protein